MALASNGLQWPCLGFSLERSGLGRNQKAMSDNHLRSWSVAHGNCNDTLHSENTRDVCIWHVVEVAEKRNGMDKKLTKLQCAAVWA